jgi:hypothetical protein
VELPIPNAEKNFLWRACHEILPTKASLFRRKVTIDVLCPICGLGEETCFHILWDCPSAKDVWGGSLKKFQKNCMEEEMCLFAGIARRVWFRRNEAVYEDPFLHPNILARQARDAMLSFLLRRGS